MMNTTLQIKVFITRPRKEHYPTEDEFRAENAITLDNMQIKNLAQRSVKFQLNSIAQ